MQYVTVGKWGRGEGQFLDGYRVIVVTGRHKKEIFLSEVVGGL